ncbi:MAG: phosphatidylglycerophosphatase A [Candidatus Aminicenantaceae bacterium]
MKTIWKILATFFGVGFFPIAPGTLTSLIIVILYKFFLHDLSWQLYIIIFILFFFIGVYASSSYAIRLKEKDPRKIVIDEACGQLFVLFHIPDSWLPLLIGFFLFRLFDIIKPYPIKKFEYLAKGWGIMIDDIIAAVYAAFILNIYLLLK